MVLVSHTTLCFGGKMSKVIIYLLIFFCFLAGVQAEPLYVIGHKGSFKPTKNSQVFADYYLLKVKTNDKGIKIIPINLPINHPLRQQFSSIIFNRSPYALNEYWDRMSFRGIRPPIVQNSEHAVLLFVSRIQGAIGYVSKKPSNTNVVVLGVISQ